PEAARRDRLLALHQAAPALFFDLIRQGFREIIGSRAFHGVVAKAPDPVERRFVEPVEEKGKVRLGLAREADNEARAQRDIRTDGAPRANALARLLRSSRTAHTLEHGRRCMLEWDIQIRQDLAL